MPARDYTVRSSGPRSPGVRGAIYSLRAALPALITPDRLAGLQSRRAFIGQTMTEIDKGNVRLISDAVARGLRKLHTPHPVALPEDDAADLSDEGWRAILDRFEKQYAADKSGEAER